MDGTNTAGPGATPISSNAFEHLLLDYADAAHKCAQHWASPEDDALKIRLGSRLRSHDAALRAALAAAEARCAELEEELRLTLIASHVHADEHQQQRDRAARYEAALREIGQHPCWLIKIGWGGTCVDMKAAGPCASCRARAALDAAPKPAGDEVRAEMPSDLWAMVAANDATAVMDRLKAHFGLPPYDAAKGGAR